MITSLSQLDPNEVYSYADYLAWKFEERIELLRGHIAAMSAPSRTHQKISINLSRIISQQLYRSTCEVYAAPFDVRLPHFDTRNNTQVVTVVQPDLCVICDENKLDAKGCIGAPDLIIEILSPGNSRREMKDKFEIYQEVGVKEYWIVNPTEKIVNIYIRNEVGKFVGLQPCVSDDIITSLIVPNLQVDLTEVFDY